MAKQRTLLYPIAVRGKGLHFGKEATMELHPAAPDTGILFRRVDLSPIGLIPARAEYVGDTSRSTTLINQGASVSTVEHLLATLASYGVDNARIDVDNEELPIMDGSACVFVLQVKSAGLRLQPSLKRFIRILREVSVEDGDKWAKLSPANNFEMKFTIDFGPEVQDTEEICFSTNVFVEEISRARTFGFAPELNSMREQGLIRGGNLGNAVVIDEGQVINEGGLRFERELVRHKLLDAIGDLSLLGRGLIGRFSAHKSGHELNNCLLSKLIETEQDAWEEVTFSGIGEDQAPIRYDFFPMAVD